MTNPFNEMICFRRYIDLGPWDLVAPRKLQVMAYDSGRSSESSRRDCPMAQSDRSWKCGVQLGSWVPFNMQDMCSLCLEPYHVYHVLRETLATGGYCMEAEARVSRNPRLEG